MRYFYTFILMFAVALANAQTLEISFEEAEGYTLGSIHNQNGWEVTEGLDGILANQLVSDEKAKDGLWSFKNSEEMAYDWQWFPIFGAALEFDTPMNYKDFSISYDVLVTETMGADFEFVAWTVQNDEFVPVLGVGMQFQGEIYAIVDEDYAYETLENVGWTPNTWVNIKVDVNETEITYFINEEEVFSLDNYTQTDIYGFNMLHNNYGGDAYYDNFKVVQNALGVEDFVKEDIAVYPNPTQDKVNISYQGLSDFQEILVYDSQGRLVGDFTNQEINLENVEAGIYHIHATTKDGYKINRKLVKQ